MFVFRSTIDIPANAPLAGYADRVSGRSSAAAQLELHGVGVTGPQPWELCSVDALYPGVLASPQPGSAVQRVMAASHTHFAPMLDPAQPELGQFDPALAALFQNGLLTARRETVEVDNCTLYAADVALPVYRRFDDPPTVLNRLLSRHGGFFPNEHQVIDRAVRIFVLGQGSRAMFALVHHACHPVTRAAYGEVSADYVAALREAVQHRFGVSVCLFLLGCAADIRPNIAGKRIDWMPRSRLNWRFRYPPSAADTEAVDGQYRVAVQNARAIGTFQVDGAPFRMRTRSVQIEGWGAVAVPRLTVMDRFEFFFLPFEVSHRYHLDALAADRSGRKLLVSCAGDVKGYLPHPSQLLFGGYEVDASRRPTRLTRRVHMNLENLW